MVSTEISTESECVFDWDVCEVLIAERYDLFLGDKECEFIFSGIRQLAQLDTMDFSADICCDVGDSRVRQEVRERRVGIFSVFSVLEWLPWWISEPLISLRHH